MNPTIDHPATPPSGAAVRRAVLCAYERGRLRDAALAALLSLGLVMPGVVLARLTPTAIVLAVLVGAFVFVATERGGGIARMALPATVLGWIPLGCSLVAAHLGHVCTPGGCVSLCVPLCASGGLISGAWLGRVAAREAQPLRAVLFGGAVAALAGGIGCSCVGLSGAAAMGTAVVVASTLTAAVRSGAR